MPDPDQNIADNLQQSLAAMLINQTPRFSRVIVADSREAYHRIADALKGVVAGVIVKPAQWGNANDNAEDHVERLEFEIVITAAVQRGPSADDSTATDALSGHVAAVRQALLADVSRGGLASAIRFGGQFVRPTDLRGPAKFDNPRKGHEFYTAMIPLVCGRRVDRTF